jgi:DNA-binding response OmpR family regulator
MSSNRQQPLDGLAILVVEDEAVFRHQLVAFLRRQGAKVDSAENGSIAVDYCRAHSPDVILMDIVMPELDGIGLLKVIGDGPWAIIVVSGKGKYKHLQQALTLGACDYLIKPVVHFDQLIDTILTNCALLPDVKAQHEQAELERHFNELRANDIESTRLLEQLVPEKTVIIANYLLLHRRQGSSLVPLHFQINPDVFSVVLIDLGLLGDDTSVAAIILHSMLDEAWNNAQTQVNSLALEPASMLRYLNEIISVSGLQGSIGMIYGVVEGRTLTYSNAGVLDVPTQLRGRQPSLALGLSEIASYQTEQIDIDELGVHFSFQNLVGDRISFKILPLGDEVNLSTTALVNA